MTDAADALDVLTIGNALVDVLSHEDDDYLTRHGLVKGTQALIDADRSSDLYADMGPAVEVSGGSAANTATGVASLGGRAAFVGKVADDQLGEVFAHDIRATGVEFTTPAGGSGTTGHCLIVVTPDAQRTMNTFLGVAGALTASDLDSAQLRRAAVTFLEGYLWDVPPARDVFEEAARVAHGAGQRLALTLSDQLLVDRHRDDLVRLLSDIDVLFANEHELCALYQVDDFDDGVAEVAKACEVAAITRSEKGSVVVGGGEVHEVAAHPVDVVDTTGAGDLYAAGFLFGLTHGFDLPTCGRLGSLAAAEVISHLGARPEVPLAELARRELGLAL